MFYLLLILSVNNSFSQALPPIEKYTPESYAGGNQNWMVSQALNKYIYVANNEGLLEFNGAEWKIYPSPNKTIVRSVNVIGSKIYTGSYMEFGSWEHNEKGILEYTSLSASIKKNIQDDEQFWKIVDFEEWIIFQSLNNIYLYNTLQKKFSIIHYNDIITKVFIVGNAVYFHVINNGIYKIQEGKPQLMIKAELFNNDWVTNIFDNENGLLIITQKNGFFKFANQSFSKWKNDSDALLTSTSVYSCIKLTDQSIVLGTISKGIIHLQDNGKVINHFNQTNGLSNNTVLSLFEDKDQNIWAGLDNGINCINIKSPINIYDDDKGELGTVYTSMVFNDFLYLGTNQGLYLKHLSSEEPFKFIHGTKGQVWNLFKIGNTLLCGHDSGTFSIENDKATLISPILGTWSFRKIPGNEPLILQGHYTGFSVLQQVNGKWKLRNKIKNFDISSRFFEIDAPNSVWMNHEYKGVYKLILDKDYQKATNVSIESSLPKGKNSSIVLFKNKLLYAYKGGIFFYNTNSKTFVKDSLLTNIYEQDVFTSGKMLVDETDKLWLFTKNNIYYLSSGQFSNKPLVHKFPIPLALRKAMIGYENISLFKDQTYLLGKVNGFITLEITKSLQKEYVIHLNSVKLKKIDAPAVDLDFSKKGDFKHTENSFEIDFSVPEYEKHLAIDYQYLLEGMHSNWTHLEDVNKVNLDNLPHGEYILKVRAQVGDTLTMNEIVFPLKINKPWFLSVTAWIVYCLIAIALTSIIHKTYKKYYQKKHALDLEKRRKELELKNLENEQKIMQIRNEQLNHDIENKNRELAISTMSIIKKNEVLSNIKNELKNSPVNSNNKSVLRLIDKNLNDADDWNFFEEAFNNADKDFLKKIKKIHNTLTPNDLKMCAYLRLNLSSKEIAPLLNISVRSVEIKRYRLRKKMGLLHDTGLVNYILEI
ncbi:MAG: LuxR C-terminal-related transcriptional regulator [Flavobacteriaceae bacterium]|nr:LuxR C-terminal-related transcriptional regulator [Flavobacteriaceae bacterium]